MTASGDDVAEQQLAYIVRKSRLQNTAILVKGPSCSPGSPPHLRSVLGEHRFPVLAACLSACLATRDAKQRRVVVAVQGGKVLDAAVAMIREHFDEYHPGLDLGQDGLVHGLQGHADIVEFSHLWRDAFATHRILLTSAQSLLFLFAHGLLRMEQLSHLILDDCTLANANHPYCTIINSFYLPQRARLLRDVLDHGSVRAGELELAARLPRVLLFADWPLVQEGEDFLTKRDRIAKMLQYLRVFQCVIRPLGSELKAPEGSSWLPYDELICLKDSGCFEQLATVYLEPGKMDLRDRLECVVERVREGGAAHAGVLVLVKEDSLLSAEHLLLREFGTPCEMLSTASPGTTPGTLLLCSTSDTDENAQLLVCYLEQQQSALTLSAVYLAEACLSPVLLQALVVHARQVPVCSIRALSRDSLQEQALEMALWMAAIGASSAVDSAPFRKLRAFVGGYEAAARQAYLLADDSPIHHTVPGSDALISTATSMVMLLCCSSYLPRVESAGTGLRVRTIAVKRVSADGQELDTDRHYYITRISLPLCLEPWIQDAGLMQVQGPVTPSRFSSQTLAANAALRLLHEKGVLDAHLIISPAVLATLFSSGSGVAEREEKTAHRRLQYNPFEDDEAVDDGTAVQTQELVPIPFQKGPEWQALERGKIEHAEPLEDFCCYAFRYTLGLLNETEQHKRTGIKTGSDEKIVLQEEDLLPADTLIHLCDDSFLNTDDGSRTFALMTRRPLVLHLRPVELRIGANVILHGTLEPIRSQDTEGLARLTRQQVGTLKDFQAFTFGLISVRTLEFNDPEDEKEAEAGMLDESLPPRPKLSVPDEKQSLFFVGLAVKSDMTGRTFDPHDLGKTLDAYRRFIGRVGERLRDHVRPRAGETRTSWELDWPLMEQAVGAKQRVSLYDYVLSLEAFQRSHAAELGACGPAPVFPYPSDPSRAPLVVDFRTFALRRLALHAPYNGYFYRAKTLAAELTPASPFESASVPGAETYADFVRLKYGLAVSHLEQPMVQVKRSESSSVLGWWLQAVSRTHSGQRRHRPGRFQKTTSYIIPELVEILPVPYALVRMAMLIPKAVHDIEKQVLIHEFYAVKLPSILAEGAQRDSLKLPPSTVLVDSMTGPTASLTYDFERLEILGDSYLKLVVSIDLLLTCPPTTNEGRLSSRRQELICNARLYDISTRLDIYRYARLTPFFARLWCPPDLAGQFDAAALARLPLAPQLFDEGVRRWRLVGEADERAGKRSALHHLGPDGTLVDRGAAAGDHVVLAGIRKNQRHRSPPSSTPVLSRFGQPIPPKTMADLLEAIIGAVYKTSGYAAGIVLLRGLGLVSDAMTGHRDVDPAIALSAIRGPDVQVQRSVVPPGTPRPAGIEPYVPGEEAYPYAEIEARLGYRFRSRRLLFVAVTHCSVDVVHSNERLEWLGDAVLDWVITEYYWERYGDEKWMTPARITVCRQAAVCNEAFSRVAVHIGLHPYLRIDAPVLQQEIAEYVKAVMAVESGPAAADPEGPLSALSWNTRYTLADGDEAAGEGAGQDAAAPRLTVPPAPKAIGDLFEAVAGAVFLDLGFDVPAFAAVYLPLIRWYLDRHADPYDLPENPISDFWHDYLSAGVPPSAIEFRYSQPEEAVPGVALSEKPSSATCQILVRGRLVAEATAPTKVLARKFATRQAVIYIRSSGWRDFLS